MVGKRDPLSEDPKQGWAACGTANGGSWKRSSGSPSRGWPHPWNPQRMLRGSSPESVHPQEVLVQVPTQDRGPAEESRFEDDKTASHHKITTGTAVRQAPPRTRHENRRTESSDRQSPVSLRCRFLIVNGRTRGSSLDRRLATWGVAASWSAGRASGTGRGREGEALRIRDPLRHFFYFLFFLTGKSSERCGIRLQAEVPQRNIVASQPVSDSQ